MDKLEWMPDNPHELKKGYVGITDPFEPRVLLARGFNDGSIATAKAIGAGLTLLIALFVVSVTLPFIKAYAPKIGAARPSA